MNIIEIPIDLLKKAEYNPREISPESLNGLKKSIERFGYLEPIIWNKRTGHVVGGHQRLKVLDAQKVQSVKVVEVDLDELEEKALNITLNNPNIQGEFTDDLQALLSELSQDDTFEDFEELKLDALVDEDFQDTLDSNDDSALDEIPEDVETIVKEGDLWQLGEHRLLCGDSFLKENIDRLLDGNEPDLLLTDPPYGINIVNKKKDGKKKVGDDNRLGFVGVKGIVKAREYKEVIGDDKPFDPSLLLEICDKKIIFGGNHFANLLPNNSHWLVWDKKCEKGADGNDFSDCELAWTSIKGKTTKIYRYLWSGLLREGSRDLELKERVHPTQKPVGLMIKIINDYSESGNKIIDPFLGSGSTLIACKETNRKCYGMEMSPDYCDVIIKRWEDLTDEKAIKL